MDKKQATRPSKWYESPLNSRIREQMEANEMTQTELAGKLKVSPEAIRLWCGGYARPDLDKLCSIADIFGVSVDFLIGHSKFSSPDIDAQGINKKIGLSAEAQKKLGEIYSHSPHLIAVFCDLCTDDLQAMLSEIYRFREVQNVISAANAQVDTDAQMLIPEVSIDIAGYKKEETGENVPDISLEEQFAPVGTALENALQIGSLLDLCDLLSIAVQKTCYEWIGRILSREDKDNG